MKILLILLLLVGCGSEEDVGTDLTQSSPPSSTPTPTPTPTVTVACVMPENMVGSWSTQKGNRVNINSDCTWDAEACGTSGTFTKYADPIKYSNGDTYYGYYLNVQDDTKEYVDCLGVGRYKCAFGVGAARDPILGVLVCKVNNTEISQYFTKI